MATEVESKKLVDDADKVFKGLEDHIRSRGGAEERGTLSPNIVRKTLELAKKSSSYIEFKLKFAYLIAHNIQGRREGSPLQIFYDNLIKTSGGDLAYLRKLMEYVVMRNVVLAKLESQPRAR